MTEKILRAGVAREIISPPRGIFLIGYGDRSKGNHGVHDDLTATALVFDNGQKSLAIIACDLLCLNEYIVDRIRAGCPGVEVMICCSHTHSGPIGYADERSPRLDRTYIDELVRHICKAVMDARGGLQPVKLAWSQASSDIAINRREKLADGKMIIGENPGGAAWSRTKKGAASTAVTAPPVMPLRSATALIPSNLPLVILTLAIELTSLHVFFMAV